MKSARMSALLLVFWACSSTVQAQYAVYDAAAASQRATQHADQLSKWVESINKATEQINKLNDLVNHMDNLEGLIGKGLEAIGIDPSITSAIDLAKSLNNFGNAIQDLQQTSMGVPGRIADSLDKLRQDLTDPDSWQRYVITSRSYDATQTAQKNYDDQMKRLQQERAKAQAQLKAAKSLGETAKAQAALDSVDAAAKALAEERKRSFEQQQANFFENQNQKDAWQQACRDWTAQELSVMAKSINNYLKIQNQ
ncbi:MAG: hypothetical protein PHV34_13985 [Verrucomicrobiae bacterium]|nr:hypothetical protein [Verrucomicrobiae bacterium]